MNAAIDRLTGWPVCTALCLFWRGITTTIHQLFVLRRISEIFNESGKYLSLCSVCMEDRTGRLQDRELTALPNAPLLVGMGQLPPSQEPHPHFWPFGPQFSDLSGIRRQNSFNPLCSVFPCGKLVPAAVANAYCLLNSTLNSTQQRTTDAGVWHL